MNGTPMHVATTSTPRTNLSPACWTAHNGRAGLAMAALALLLLLSACGGANSGAVVDTAVMARAAKLALGTINLEGTVQAVDAEHASQLLPLWELLADMSASPSAAPEELAAVVEQLEAAMTPGQLGAIAVMEFPQAEIDGATLSAGTLPLEGSVASAEVPPAAVVVDPGLGGDMGAGGPPDAGGLPGEVAPGGLGSSNTAAGNPGAGNIGATALFQRVVALLQSKLPS